MINGKVLLRAFSAAVVCFLVVLSGSSSRTAAQAPPWQGAGNEPAVPNVTADNEPLVDATSFIYQGAFRVPAGTSDPLSFNYGGTALAYSPERNSLFLVGHDQFQRIAELNIPTPGTASLATGLPVATYKQPLADLLSARIPDVLTDLGLPPGYIPTVKVGGILPLTDGLILNMYVYYDGEGKQRVSHFKLPTFDLTRKDLLQGPSQVGDGRAGFVDGWMPPIPSEWQSFFGATALTGQCCLSIITRTSHGPSVSTFDPTAVGAPIVPATRVLGYPFDHPTLGQWGETNNLFNGSTVMGGAVFIPTTRSVLFFGRHGPTFCYGIGVPGTPISNPGPGLEECTDPTDGSKGTHGYPYVYQVWAYDALDLLRVKNGTANTWDIQPYKTWNFELPFEATNRRLGGVAFDAANGRLFVLAQYGNGVDPLIHVYTLGTARVKESRPAMSVDSPADQAKVPLSFTVSGWAIDRGETANTGIDAVHVWARPTGSSTGPAIFVDQATLGGSRPDVATVYGGSQFTNSGFSLNVSSVPAGQYKLEVYAHSSITGTFNNTITRNITVGQISDPVLAIDAPAAAATVSTTGFTVSGWAIDKGALSGTGVDAVDVWAVPAGSSTASFVARATSFTSRPDIATAYGNAQFTNAGYSVTATLAAGQYTLLIYSHSLIANSFNRVVSRNVTVTAPVSDPYLAVDAPAAGGTVPKASFTVSGWALDKNAPSGTGVDAVDVWAVPAGSSTASFVGRVTSFTPRSDVATAFGSTQFTNSGYSLQVTTMTPGTYTLLIYEHTIIANAFNRVASRAITVQ